MVTKGQRMLQFQPASGQSSGLEDAERPPGELGPDPGTATFFGDGLALVTAFLREGEVARAGARAGEVARAGDRVRRGWRGDDPATLVLRPGELNASLSSSEQWSGTARAGRTSG